MSGAHLCGPTQKVPPLSTLVGHLSSELLLNTRDSHQQLSLNTLGSFCSNQRAIGKSELPLAFTFVLSNNLGTLHIASHFTHARTSSVAWAMHQRGTRCCGFGNRSSNGLAFSSPELAENRGRRVCLSFHRS